MRARGLIPVLALAAFCLRAGQSLAGEAVRVLLVADGGGAVIALDDNAAARDLLSRLPLTLSAEDFNGTEKIAMLPAKLATEGAPDSCAPDAGSVAYYAPWGNLAMFYRPFRLSRGLVPLGRVESGMDVIRALPDGAAIRLEAAPRGTPAP